MEELDIELSESPVCSYAHHNTAEPCWGAVVFRGIAPTCTGHSTMVSKGYYTSEEQMKRSRTTGGTLRLSNRGATAMQVPEELSGMWKGAPQDKVVPEVSVMLFPEMARPEMPKKPTNLHLTNVEMEEAEMGSVIQDEPINPNVKISVSDDTEIPEAWKDYL